MSCLFVASLAIQIGGRNLRRDAESSFEAHSTMRRRSDGARGGEAGSGRCVRSLLLSFVVPVRRPPGHSGRCLARFWQRRGDAWRAGVGRVRRFACSPPPNAFRIVSSTLFAAAHHDPVSHQTTLQTRDGRSGRAPSLGSRSRTNRSERCAALRKTHRERTQATRNKQERTQTAAAKQRRNDRSQRRHACLGNRFFRITAHPSFLAITHRDPPLLPLLRMMTPRLSLPFALALCVVLALAAPVAAHFTFPDVISSHMVLQRNSRATVWGFTDCPISSTVSLSVSVEGSSAAPVLSSPTHPLSDLSFSIDVGAMIQPDISQSYSLTFTDCHGSTTFTDVRFGDVILCAGQSNMEMSIWGMEDAQAQVTDSANYPGLRLFSVRRAFSGTPQQMVYSRSPSFQWAVSGPSAFVAGDDVFQGTMSATCYFTARELYKSLGGTVPIGMIAAAWAGTAIELWSSPAALSGCSAWPLPAHDPILENSYLWNGMIYPLRRMRFSLVVWYQGEANFASPLSYRCRFPAMIRDWRSQLNNTALPFAFVQLEAFPDGTDKWPAQQISQTAALDLPHVTYASAIDMGDPNSPFGSVHPRSKEALGKRLALAIGAMNYAQTAVSSGPQPTTITFSLPLAAAALILTFRSDLASNRGLRFGGTANCQTCCNVSPFKLVDTQGHWYRTQGVQILDTTIVVPAPALAPGVSVAAITYAYQRQSEIHTRTASEQRPSMHLCGHFVRHLMLLFLVRSRAACLCVFFLLCSPAYAECVVYNSANLPMTVSCANMTHPGNACILSPDDSSDATRTLASGGAMRAAVIALLMGLFAKMHM